MEQGPGHSRHYEGEADLDSLWTVEQRIAEPARECFQFSPGRRHGIPWRRDSMYLPVGEIPLLEWLLRGELRWFHANGVTTLTADEALRLAVALRAFAATTDRPHAAAPVLALGDWIAAHAADGLTIERA